MLYLLLAEGFEETEAVAPLDVLRRAGIPVKTVGITGKTVQSTHGLTVTADILPEDVKFDDMDGVILPGGMPGTLNLQKDEFVGKAHDYCAQNKKLVAAICAAPMILGELNLLDGRNATCFPGFEENLNGANIVDDSVARDENFITGKGAGVALEFGAEIVDYFTENTDKGPGGFKVLKKMQVR